MNWNLDLGANFISKSKATFKIWAPLQKKLKLKILNKTFSEPIEMQKDENGYFSLKLEGVKEGDLYSYITDYGNERPDPVSRFLPNSVHGPSSIVNPKSFKWTDNEWNGIQQESLIFYECHVGTFTEEGTFEAIIKKISYLKELGVTCLELMPVSQFPGQWNWGYDGASLYAPQNSYGGPIGLKALINACHKEGLAVCLDVVYNHFGPEGTYLAEFGPYFSDKYYNPWGNAVNFDGAYCDHVRHYLIKNALYWIDEFHFDVLRLDAIHGIYDLSAYSFLEELNDHVVMYGKDKNRKIQVVAESDLNDPRIMREKKQGGYGLAATWSDDFHHSLHVALTNQQTGYYIDFNGIQDFATTLMKGYVYDNKYSTYRKRHHGNTSDDLPFKKYITCLQNHDQIGNRPDGSRLVSHVSFEALKLSAFALILAPYIPLIFMGQEYGEITPFQYFIDFGDKKLQEAVYESRKKEFGADTPKVGKEAFIRSKLSWAKDTKNLVLLQLYKDLIKLRKDLPPLQQKKEILVYFSLEQSWVAWEYKTTSNQWIGIVCHFAKEANTIATPFKKISNQKIICNSDSISYDGNNFLAKTSNGLFLPPESACIVN